MSMLQTAYVARTRVPQREALQAAIDALGFDCKLDESYTPFKSRGFLPCNLCGKESGFEIYFEPTAGLLEQFPLLARELGDREVAMTMRWGGDMAECACVMVVSAALANESDALVHYQNDDMLYSKDQLIEEANTALAEVDR
jgi:hypothetical protein